jgi:hypothetical protein
MFNDSLQKGAISMARLTRFAAAAVLGALLIAGPAYAGEKGPKIQGEQEIGLRAHAKNITGYAGPVNTAGILPAGKLYVAEVSGAISYYGRKQYRHPSGLWNTVCGEPLEDSKGGPLGIDAEFVFARPWTSPCPRKLPVRWDNFEISVNNGAIFAHPAPLDGPFAAPTPGHRYSYALVGVGAYALFRLRDNPGGHPATEDNYGKLQIKIRKAVSGDCGGTNYLLFGKSTEGECLAAV